MIIPKDIGGREMRCVFADKLTNLGECEGPVNFAVKNYWRGEARAKLGPDAYYCRKHAVDMKILHPYDRQLWPIKVK